MAIFDGMQCCAAAQPQRDVRCGQCANSKAIVFSFTGRPLCTACLDSRRRMAAALWQVVRGETPERVYVGDDVQSFGPTGDDLAEMLDHVDLVLEAG